MKALLFWNTLAAGAAWAIVVARLVVVLRRQPQLSSQARQQVWFFWGAFFCFALATTAYNPTLQTYLKMPAWFRDFPQTTFAIVAYIVGVRICYGFAPSFRPHHDWPLYLGIGTLAVYLFVAWAAHAALAVRSLLLENNAIARLMLDALLLVVVGRIVLPAYNHAWRNEGQRPMRLRFWCIGGMHLLVALWLAIEIGDTAARVLGIALNLTPTYALLGVGITVLFSAHFLPLSYFVYLARASDYSRDWLTYWHMRRLQLEMARHIGRKTTVTPWREAWRDPGLAVYRSVISIFDMRKLLQRCDTEQAQVLSRQLDQIGLSQPDYEVTVACLRHLASTPSWRYPTPQSALNTAAE